MIPRALLRECMDKLWWSCKMIILMIRLLFQSHGIMLRVNGERANYFSLSSTVLCVGATANNGNPAPTKVWKYTIKDLVVTYFPNAPGLQIAISMTNSLLIYSLTISPSNSFCCLFSISIARQMKNPRKLQLYSLTWVLEPAEHFQSKLKWNKRSLNF